MLDQRKQRLRSALYLLPAALPAIYIGLSVLIFSVDSPMWDEWFAGGYLDKFARGTLSFQDLFEQQNEYRQFFPNLIFVSLGWLTSWDVRSWMALSFLLAALISFNIYHLGKWSLAGRFRWSYLIANLIIFSPVQYENWLQGQQLVYFLPIACFTAALLVASAANLRIGLRFALCALASIISSFSSANGMLCWVLLLPVLAWSPSRKVLWQKKWWIVAWTACFVMTAVVYFRGYHTPPQHYPLSWMQMNPVKTAVYFLAMLGRPLTPGRLIAAATVGFVLFSLFVWACFRFWKVHKSSESQAHRMLCWLMLGAYSILTSALITIGRFGQDPAQGLPATRYTTYSLYLSVALVYLLPMAPGVGSQQPRFFQCKFSTARAITILTVGLIVIHLPIYLLGFRQMSTFRAATLQSKACALFVNVLQDECLSAKVYPDIDVLKKKINPADRLGFIRPGLIKTNRVKDIESAPRLGQHNRGEFQSLVHVEGSRYVASGWANLPDTGEPADAVLLAYEEEPGLPIIFALAPLNTERDLVSALIGRGRYGDSRWSEAFSLSDINPDRVKLSAWGFDASTGKAYKLDGEHDFPKSASSGQK